MFHVSYISFNNSSVMKVCYWPVPPDIWFCIIAYKNREIHVHSFFCLSQLASNTGVSVIKTKNHVFFSCSMYISRPTLGSLCFACPSIHPSSYWSLSVRQFISHLFINMSTCLSSLLHVCRKFSSFLSNAMNPNKDTFLSSYKYVPVVVPVS